MLPANAFRFSPSLVAVLDAADGTIVDVNPAFEQLLGIPRAEAIGKRTVELNVWPHLETRAAIWMRIRGEQLVRGDIVTMRTRDGRRQRPALRRVVRRLRPHLRVCNHPGHRRRRRRGAAGE